MTVLVCIIIFIYGAVWGSFLALVGLRLPVGKSIVRPRSACPGCGGAIKGMALVPLLGWLVCKGRCQHCHMSIGWLYPLIELLTGLSFVLIYFMMTTMEERIIAGLVVSLLIAMIVSDIKYKLLPNKIIYPAMVIFLLIRIIYHPLPIWHYGLGFIVGGGILYAVSYVFVKLNKPAMGGGDIKLMSLLGLVVGLELILFVVLVSAFAGMMAGLILIVSGKMKRQEALAFGPYIAFACFIAMVYGRPMLDWYYHLF